MIEDETLMASRLSRRTLLKLAGATASMIPLGALLAACGDDDDEEEEEGGTGGAAATTEPAGGAGTTPAGEAAGGDEEHVVEMTDDLTFDPDNLTIRVGETVTWRTVGQQPHTSTCDPGKANDPSHVKLPEGAEPWDSGIVQQGQEFSHTFETAGEYTYFCIPHEAAGMIGNITVEEG